jgi:hypothetical protein
MQLKRPALKAVLFCVQATFFNLAKYDHVPIDKIFLKKKCSEENSCRNYVFSGKTTSTFSEFLLY